MSVRVVSTMGQAVCSFKKIRNSGISEADGRAVDCLLISLKQAAQAQGITEFEQLSIPEIRAEMALAVTSRPPDEASYKLHASLLEEPFDDILLSMLPSETDYLDRAMQFLSPEQQAELDRLPTTISERIEVASKLFPQRPCKQFATKASHLEHLMSLLNEEQRATVLKIKPASDDRRLQHAKTFLSESQKEEVFRLDPIPEEIKSAVILDIQNEMLTWEVFHLWIKTVHPSVNVVLCMHKKGDTYECGNYGTLDPKKPFLFIARNGLHFEALIPASATAALITELYVIDGWRMAGIREIRMQDGKVLTIYTSKLDTTTAAVHIQPQNILRLMPLECDFIKELFNIPRLDPGQLHRFDQEVCNNLHISPATDGALAEIAVAVSRISMARTLRAVNA